MKTTLYMVLFNFLCSLSVQFNLPETNTTTRSLSRKKRFLIFPEGSSLQLVYCLTIPSIGMGNIFTIGWTAALAWELPHEPIHPYRKKEDTRRTDNKTNTKFIKPGMRKTDQSGLSTSGGWAVKPSGFTKTGQNYNFLSSSSYSTIKDYLTKAAYKKGYGVNTRKEVYSKGKYGDYRTIYDTSARRPSFKSNKVAKEEEQFYFHPAYKEVHRRTRRDLFTKIEKFLTALKLDGKACLLKAICEVSKSSVSGVGTFMEEIIKAIFRIKPYANENYEDEFDLAADNRHNCTEKYSRCSSSIWSLL